MMENIRDKIFDWPLVRGFNQKMQARHELEQNIDRAAVAKRLSELKTESETKLKVRNAAVDQAQQRVEAANLELRAAELELDTAQRERMGATFEFQAAIDAQRAVLRRTASPKIDEAARELDTESTRLRGVVTSKMFIGFDTRVNRDVNVAISNARDVNAKQDAIRAALKQLDQLREKIVDNIDAEIATILSAIPELIRDEEVRAVIEAPREPERPRYNPAVARTSNQDEPALENVRTW